MKIIEENINICIVIKDLDHRKLTLNFLEAKGYKGTKKFSGNCSINDCYYTIDKIVYCNIFSIIKEKYPNIKIINSNNLFK